MKIGLFGGSFDPIHSEHVEYVLAAKEFLALDRVIVIPSYIAPHKRGGSAASGKDRLAMCKIVFGKYDFAEVSDYEIRAGGTSYTYLTCRHFRDLYPNDTLFFLVGADMLENFFHWRNPEEILSCVTLAACGRGDSAPASLHEKFISRFGVDFIEVPFTGEAVSSTELRVALAFGKGHKALDEGVLTYIRQHGLYSHPAIAPALALERPMRREHSYRVALMACRRARSLGIPEEKALLAAALHDCAKYVSLDESPLLKDFPYYGNVPEQVLHQLTGAYLAQTLFGIDDEEILDAIRYHTTGRPKMGQLEKLIYLADMLEEGRDFPGVEGLRSLFWKDLDACLAGALEHQMEYLQKSGEPIFYLTERAYQWIKSAQS